MYQDHSLASGGSAKPLVRLRDEALETSALLGIKSLKTADSRLL